MSILKVNYIFKVPGNERTKRENIFLNAYGRSFWQLDPARPYVFCEPFISSQLWVMIMKRKPKDGIFNYYFLLITRRAFISHKNFLLENVLESWFIQKSILKNIKNKYFALSRRNLPYSWVWWRLVSLAWYCILIDLWMDSYLN